MGRATTEKKSNFTNNPLLKSKINESILEMEEIKHVATNPDETLNLE